ncbi:replication protein RepA [Rothia nasimurium]|uniref:replication protein RepA n=1 Tax=Rothia nasimurium TaxID=85336 RepID=UPI001EED81D7|nr:replication protein RepA [Rothia nasimurium]
MNDSIDFTDLAKAAAEKAAATSSPQVHNSFYPAQFIYCCLPYRAIEEKIWLRENGTWTLGITPGIITNPDGSRESFIPSGKLARAALLYVTTEAVKTGSPRIELAKSYRGFMGDLGIKWDSKTAREAVRQLRAVLSMSVQLSFITADNEGGSVVTELEFKVGSGREIHFDAKADIKERESYLLLSQDFYEAVVVGHAVPIVTEAWRALIQDTKSPLALDIYLWLSSRLSNLTNPVHITWEQLYSQFGSQQQNLDDFKRKFRKALETVKEYYPGANVREMGTGQGRTKGFKGLVLYRSIPALPPQR